MKVKDVIYTLLCFLIRLSPMLSRHVSAKFARCIHVLFEGYS
jgi:hypothetical protein